MSRSCFVPPVDSGLKGRRRPGGRTQGRSSTREPPVRRGNLLLVEDNSALRQMLAWELLELGYRVQAAGSCREALTLASWRGFDVAVFDADLPDGDGVELAGELIRERPDLRVVICSGRQRDGRDDKAHGAVLAYLTKPVSLDLLHALLQSGGAGLVKD